MHNQYLTTLLFEGFGIKWQIIKNKFCQENYICDDLKLVRKNKLHVLPTTLRAFSHRGQKENS